MNATRESAAGTDHFSAAKVEIAMLPEHNLAKEMTATGNVVAESKQGGDSRVLKTEALRVVLRRPQRRRRRKPVEQTAGQGGRTAAHRERRNARAGHHRNHQRGDTTTLAAKKFVAGLDASGRLEKLFGHGGVDVRRQIGKEAPQTISARGNDRHIRALGRLEHGR